jgi:hypothetical protein
MAHDVLEGWVNFSPNSIDCLQGWDQATSKRRLIKPSPTFGHNSTFHPKDFSTFVEVSSQISTKRTP